MSNLPRRLTAGLLLSCATGTALLLPAAPALAAAKATLVVTVATTATPPLPGRTATYTITVHNTGTVGAGAVQLEMTTDVPITGISVRVNPGRCYRSALETVCAFGTVRAGASATATVSGALPKDARLHSNASVTAKVTSSTPLTAPAWSMLVYPIGGPAAPPVHPSPPPPSAPAEEPAAAQDGESTAQWLQPTGFTRALAIGFAAFVIGLLVAGRLWERRRATHGTPVAVPHPATGDLLEPPGVPGFPDQPEPVPSQAGPQRPESAGTVDASRDQ